MKNNPYLIWNTHWLWETLSDCSKWRFSDKASGGSLNITTLQTEMILKILYYTESWCTSDKVKVFGGKYKTSILPYNKWSHFHRFSSSHHVTFFDVVIQQNRVAFPAGDLSTVVKCYVQTPQVFSKCVILNNQYIAACIGVRVLDSWINSVWFIWIRLCT